MATIVSSPSNVIITGLFCFFLLALTHSALAFNGHVPIPEHGRHATANLAQCGLYHRLHPEFGNRYNFLRITSIERIEG